MRQKRRSNYARRRRVLGCQILEDRRLLVSCSSGIETTGSFAFHSFAITNPTTKPAVINVDANARGSLPISGTVTRSGPLGGGHPNTLVIVANDARNTRFGVGAGTTIGTSTTYPFSGSLSLAPGQTTVTFTAYRNASTNRNVPLPTGVTDFQAVSSAFIRACVNQRPTAQSKTFTFEEDTSVNSTVNITDNDTSESLSVTTTTDPRHGTLTGPRCQRRLHLQAKQPGQTEKRFVHLQGHR